MYKLESDESKKKQVPSNLIIEAEEESDGSIVLVEKVWKVTQGHGDEKVNIGRNPK